MKRISKIGTASGIALVGAGVALGVALTGGSHGTPQTPVVVQRVADTAAAPASLSAPTSAVRLAKPAAANDAPITIEPTTEPAPSAVSSATPEPVASPTLVNVGSGTADSGTIQPPSLPPNLVVAPLPKPQITSLPTGSASPSH